MSDSNNDLYGEREILKNYIEPGADQIWWAPDWTEKEFHSSTHRYVIVAGWGHFLRSFEVLTHFLSVPQQITPAPYNSHIDLAIQTLYISQNYQHLSDCVRRERCGRKPVSIAVQTYQLSFILNHFYGSTKTRAAQNNSPSFLNVKVGKAYMGYIMIRGKTAVLHT